MMKYNRYSAVDRLAVYKLAIMKLQEHNIDGSKKFIGLCQALRTSAGLPALVNQSVLDQGSPFIEVYAMKPRHMYDRSWWFSRDTVGNDARIRVLLLAIAQLENAV